MKVSKNVRKMLFLCSLLLIQSVELQSADTGTGEVVLTEVEKNCTVGCLKCNLATEMCELCDPLQNYVLTVDKKTCEKTSDLNCKATGS